MLQPQDAVRLLRNHHVPNLSPPQQWLLAARAAGLTPAMLETSLHRTVGTIRRDIEKLQDLIFVPLGLERDSWATATWVQLHADCCLARAWA
jgi:hypothetical protein